MGATKIIFWILATMALSGGVGVIASRRPVYSILSLIVVFFSLSGLYILMNAQFLAMVNIIVYAGAIMVLFLFVVMLMNLNQRVEPVKKILIKMAGVIAALTLMIVFVAAFAHAEQTGTPVRPGTNIGLVENLGKVLFDKYVIPFELSSVLFLSAVVGAVIIGKKDKETV